MALTDSNPIHPKSHMKNSNFPGGEQQAAVMVTGGAGMIGQKLVKSLAEKRPVVSMYHNRLPEAQEKVFPFCSDMSSVELLGAPLRGVSCVVHLAWQNSLVGPQSGKASAERVMKGTEQKEFSFPDPREVKSENLANLRNLIAAMEASGTQRLIFVSALGASNQSKNTFLREKYLAEILVLNSSIPEKIIMRPSVIYREDEQNQDRFIQSILDTMKLPVIYPMPNVSEIISPIHVDDLNQIIENLCFMERIEYPNTIIEVTGEGVIKVQNLFDNVAKKFGRKKKIPLKGRLGQSLLPFIERDMSAHSPKLRHFLDLSNPINQTSKEREEENILLEQVLPKTRFDFDCFFSK